MKNSLLLSKRKWNNASLLQVAESSRTLKTQTFEREFFPARAKTSQETNSSFFEKKHSSLLVLHPENFLRLGWDLLNLLLILTQVVILPYLISFEFESIEFWVLLDFFVNVFFITDILLNFNTAFFYRGNLVRSRRLIAKRYLKFWFWVDLLGSFPVFYLSSSEGSLIKLLRLFRVLKVKKLLLQVESVFSSVAKAFKFLKLLVTGFIIAHWTGCLWFYVSDLDSARFPNTWVSYELSHNQNPNLYIKALYFAVTTSTTVGYGDFNPVTNNELVVGVLALVVSSVLFSKILSTIAEWVSELDERNYKIRNQKVTLNIYMKNANLPYNLRFRVRRYLDYILGSIKHDKLNEEEVTQLLSEPLKNEVFRLTRGKIVKSCKVFKQLYNSKLIGKISNNIKQSTLAPDDVVFYENENSFRLYMISSGSVEVFQKETNSIFKVLKKGDYFGEIAFFTMLPRQASARCLEFANLLMLDREDLDTLLKKYPEAKSLTDLVQQRCQNNEFAVLGVRCYLCKKSGHVALKCKENVLFVDHKAIKDNWVKLRSERCKYVNPMALETPPTVRRTKNPQRKTYFSSRHVLGIPRQPQGTFVPAQKDPVPSREVPEQKSAKQNYTKVLEDSSEEEESPQVSFLTPDFKLT